MAERDSRKRRKRSSRRPETRRERKGGLTSLRSGFRNLVGTGKSKKKLSAGETFLWLLILVAVVILLVLSLVR